MNHKLTKIFIVFFLASVFSTLHSAGGINKSLSKDTAKVFIISPKDKETVENPITVIFGIEDMEIVPAGENKKYSGHHHLLIDVENLPDLSKPIPSDKNHMHFGKGQTNTSINLTKGEHTLQLLVGDYIHVPHDIPIYSEKITITVK